MLLPPKKFECVKCEYKTHKKGALKEHVELVHDKIKNYKCEDCGLAFGRKQTLTRHVVRRHINAKVVKTKWECRHCDRVFGRKHKKYPATSNTGNERVFDQKVDVQSKYDFQHRKESIPELQKDTDCNNEFMESKVNEDVKAEGSVAVGDYVVFEDIH